jgi:hypothetical protein
MASDKRFDESISRWLEAGAPKQLPDRVLRATFERTRRTRQQESWRALLGRIQMPRFVSALGGAAVLVIAAVLALNFYASQSSIGGPATLSPSLPPTQPPTAEPTTPPSAAPEVTALLNGFLDARVAGAGAQQYLNVPEEDVPVLYATTSGAPYERAEFEQVRGITWPYGFTAFKLRLFAGDTVVEQLFFTASDGPMEIAYQPDGFGTDIAPTTEDGQPVAVPYNFSDGEVTLPAAHPWVFHDGSPVIRLIPEGPGVRPTTDGGERNHWDWLVLTADPVWVGTDCRKGPDSADAEALAESIRSDPGLEATAPVEVSAGGAEALMMDVKIAAGAPLCVPATWAGDPLDVGLLHLVFSSRSFVADHDDAMPEWERLAKGVATGQWMRLYLFDVPEGSSMRTLAIAIIAPESRFERAVEAAAPMIDSIEFHAP